MGRGRQISREHRRRQAPQALGCGQQHRPGLPARLRQHAAFSRNGLGINETVAGRGRGQDRPIGLLWQLRLHGALVAAVTPATGRQVRPWPGHSQLQQRKLQQQHKRDGEETLQAYIVAGPAAFS